MSRNKLQAFQKPFWHLASSGHFLECQPPASEISCHLFHTSVTVSLPDGLTDFDKSIHYMHSIPYKYVYPRYPGS